MVFKFVLEVLKDFAWKLPNIAFLDICLIFTNGVFVTQTSEGNLILDLAYKFSLDIVFFTLRHRYSYRMIHEEGGHSVVT